MTFSNTHNSIRSDANQGVSRGRIILALCLIGLAWAAIVARFFQLQVLDRRMYQVLASDQHEIQSVLIPRRGTIYLRDHSDGKLYPIAKDRDSWNVYAMPREMTKADPRSIAATVANVLGVDESDLAQRFATSSVAYTIIAKDVSLERVVALRAERLAGIGVTKGLARQYPESEIGGHMLGFVTQAKNNERIGRYGLESYAQEELAGKLGSIQAEKDAAGRRLTFGTIDMKRARDGSDIVLTLDRTVQYTACNKIQEAIKEFEAESGTVIIMDPNSGAIIAMCSAPDFDPEFFNKVSDMSVFNNPAVSFQFEPGSIFKPVTLSAGLDAGKITPQTTYTDPGVEVIDGFAIRNSDKKAHGLRTMTQVLEESLNTGTIFVQRLIGAEKFRDYVRAFGFGTKTGIELPVEAKGNISSLDRKGKIFAATGSFGQGISVTPLQMVAAFAALGNGGQLVKPYIIEEIIAPDGSHMKTEAKQVRRVISERTSRLISAMMVNVVEKGHGKRAGVPGYYVAGKTGTAQIARTDGKGYLEDATIGSFIGFAPADSPKFVMLIKLDRPKTVTFAESSAAPTFGALAKFLLTYYEVPPERPIKNKPASAAQSSITTATSGTAP